MATNNSPKMDDYTKIDEAYDPFLVRKDVSSSDPSVMNVEDMGATEGNPTIPYGVQSSETSINSPQILKTGTEFTDVFLENVIRSKFYIPKKQGFIIDARRGYIECMELYVIGGIFSYNKTSPLDPQMGYWFGPYDGEAVFVIGDEYKQMDWNVTEKNQLSLKKAALSTTGNAVNILDLSSDGNASALIYFTGGNAAKELLRVEMPVIMTQAKTGIMVEKAGGASEALIAMDNIDGSVDKVLYARNQFNSGQVAFFWQDDESNQEQVVHVRADAPISSDYYKMMFLDAQGTIGASIYVANDADPNQKLTGEKGDLCLSTNGETYNCQGGTSWTAMTGDSYVFGTGADGNIDVSSGATNLGSPGKNIYQYNNFSVTGTASVVGTTDLWTNPTYILVRGNLTVTSSASPAINWDYLGAAGGTFNGSYSSLSASNGSAWGGDAEFNGGIYPGGGGGTKESPFASIGASYRGTGGGGGGSWISGGTDGGYNPLYPGLQGAGGYTRTVSGTTSPKLHILMPYYGGGGGGGGGSTNNYPSGGQYGSVGGVGGRGGGCVIFIVKGSINITSTFSAVGQDGGTTVASTSSPYVYGGGGGGGGGGFVGIYHVGDQIANTSSFLVTGGAGGTVVSGYNGGAGGTGWSEIKQVPYLNIRI